MDCFQILVEGPVAVPIKQTMVGKPIFYFAIAKQNHLIKHGASPANRLNEGP